MSDILIDRSYPGVTILTLNRPEKRNALSFQVIRALEKAINETHHRVDQRALILRGEGKAFCTGLDLAETIQIRNAETIGIALSKLFTSLFTSPLVTIAAVQGFAIAGGGGIAAACDLVVAGNETRFGFPEVRRGLVAALVSTFLQRQISERHIRELLLLGELVDAKRAYEMGLVNRVVPEEKILEEALHLAQLALKGAPASIVETKRLLEQIYPRKIGENMEVALMYHKQSRTHLEAQEGIRAFLEDRKPNWDKENH